jgi:capsular exopolysaccharide synthesis family protein
MEAIRYARFLRRWWWFLVLGLLLGCASSYAVSRLLTPTYRASATVLVNETQVPGTIAYNDILTSERLTKTYRELIKKRPVLEAVITELSLPLEPEELTKMIDVEVVRDTQLLRVSAESSDPEEARLIADATANAFIVENSKDQLSRSGSVSVVEAATTPDSPVRPNIPLNTILGALAGLIVAGGLAALLEYLDDTVKSPEEVEAAAGLATLGGVARFHRPRPPESGLVATRHRHPVAEAYRMLRTNVQFSTLERPAQTLLVTSANPGEGKTTTVANLALVMAQAGKRVIAVDSDLRRPALHRLLGVENETGLTNLLLSQEPEMNGCVKSTAFDNLWVLPSGPQPPNPSELLGSRRLEAILQSLKQSADVIIMDSPPALAVADASILAARVDGTLLVVDSGRTRAGSLQRAKEALTRAKTNLLGAVLNKLTQRGRDYYYYRYYYADAEGHKTRRRRHGHHGGASS